MALLARRCDVFAGQWKGGLGGVIEGGSAPIGGGVAERAVLREPSRYMVRVRSALIVLQVARITSGSQAFVNAAGVALYARRCDVFAGQWECGLGSVIEGGAGPIGGGVAE